MKAEIEDSFMVRERRRWRTTNGIVWEDDIDKTYFLSEEEANKLASEYRETHELLEPETILENANTQKWFTFDSWNGKKSLAMR